MESMDWIKFLEMICLPIFGWFFYKLGDLRRELNDFKVQVAKEYATQVNITRLETKIDNLHQLLWEMKNDTNTSRNKKEQPRQYSLGCGLARLKKGRKIARSVLLCFYKPRIWHQSFGKTLAELSTVIWA